MAGQIRVHASFEVKDASMAKGEAVKTVVEITNKEKGCIHYQLYQDAQTPTKFAFIEIWETAEDLKRHGESAHVKEFKAKAEGFVTGPISVTMYKNI